jgi:hypothetical protein
MTLSLDLTEAKYKMEMMPEIIKGCAAMAGG